MEAVVSDGGRPAAARAIHYALEDRCDDQPTDPSPVHHRATLRTRAATDLALTRHHHLRHPRHPHAPDADTFIKQEVTYVYSNTAERAHM